MSAAGNATTLLQTTRLNQMKFHERYLTDFQTAPFFNFIASWSSPFMKSLNSMSVEDSFTVLRT